MLFWNWIFNWIYNGIHKIVRCLMWKKQKYFKSFTWFCDTDKAHQNRVKWIFLCEVFGCSFHKGKSSLYVSWESYHFQCYAFPFENPYFYLVLFPLAFLAVQVCWWCILLMSLSCFCLLCSVRKKSLYFIFILKIIFAES